MFVHKVKFEGCRLYLRELSSSDDFDMASADINLKGVIKKLDEEPELLAVNIFKCSLSDSVVESLTKILAFDSRFKELSLIGNEGGSELLLPKIFSQISKTSCELRKLVLEQKTLTGDAFRALVKFIKNSATLSKVSINTSLNPFQAAVILAALKENHSITHCQLPETDLDEKQRNTLKSINKRNNSQQRYFMKPLGGTSTMQKELELEGSEHKFSV